MSTEVDFHVRFALAGQLQHSRVRFESLTVSHPVWCNITNSSKHSHSQIKWNDCVQCIYDLKLHGYDFPCSSQIPKYISVMESLLLSTLFPLIEVQKTPWDAYFALECIFITMCLLEQEQWNEKKIPPCNAGQMLSFVVLRLRLNLPSSKQSYG